MWKIRASDNVSSFPEKVGRCASLIRLFCFAEHPSVWVLHQTVFICTPRWSLVVIFWRVFSRIFSRKVIRSHIMEFILSDTMPLNLNFEQKERDQFCYRTVPQSLETGVWIIYDRLKFCLASGDVVEFFILFSSSLRLSCAFCFGIKFDLGRLDYKDEGMMRDWSRNAFILICALSEAGSWGQLFQG